MRFVNVYVVIDVTSREGRVSRNNREDRVADSDKLSRPARDV